MAQINWRTIDVDAVDPESSKNFDISTLVPALPQTSSAEVQSLGQQIRQLLRGGDAEGALRGALDMAPYGGDASTKDVHLATVQEILQSIKQAEMTPMLTRIYGSAGGPEALDTLMKYIYKGMAAAPTSPSKAMSPQSTGLGFSQIQSRGASEGGGQAMSVLLSWHEKVVEVAGQGSIVRAMSDRRTV